MMKCPSCGCECEDGMNFCGFCGAKLPQVKVCPACGAEVPLQNKFCGMCGHSFAAPSQGGRTSSSGGAPGDRNVIVGDVVGGDLIKGGGSVTMKLSGNVPLELVWIPKGSFLMGSPKGELGRRDDETQHRVTLTRDFWLGRYPVTQFQYEAVMGEHVISDRYLLSEMGKRVDYWMNKEETGEVYPLVDFPVAHVSWNDAMRFCKKLNELYKDRLPKGYRFDLPTEAQWEYACRAGTTTALNSGKDLTAEDEACPNLDELGWYHKNSDRLNHLLGQKQPNAWGLYDMHGNVYEWCRDWYGDYGGDAVDPTGPAEGSLRVLRGGSWLDYARDCRSACRCCDDPPERDGNLGFRLALCGVR